MYFDHPNGSILHNVISEEIHDFILKCTKFGIGFCRLMIAAKFEEKNLPFCTHFIRVKYINWKGRV